DTQAQADKAWFREVLRKLDYLLEKFLLFASKETEFRQYLQSLVQEIRGEPLSSHRADYGRDVRPSDSRRDKRAARDVPRRELHLESNEFGSTKSGDASIRWVQEAVEEVQSAYEEEKQELAHQLETEQDYDTKAVLEKRAAVLQRRQDYAG